MTATVWRSRSGVCRCRFSYDFGKSFKDISLFHFMFPITKRVHLTHSFLLSLQPRQSMQVSLLSMTGSLHVCRTHCQLPIQLHWEAFGRQRKQVVLSSMGEKRSLISCAYRISANSGRILNV